MKHKFLFFIIILQIFLSLVILLKFGNVAYNGDSLYEAQVARNVLDGKGYVTSEMPLYAFNMYKEIGLDLEGEWFNAHKFFLPVYLKLIFIKLFGNNLFSVTFLFSFLFHLLTIIVLYFLSFKIWPEKQILAFISSFVFLINPVLGFGSPYTMSSGLNLLVDSFIFLVFLYVMLYWKLTNKTFYLFFGGIISGIAFLDRYNSGLYIVAVFFVLLYLLIFKKYKSTSLKSALFEFIKKYSLYFSGFFLIVFLFLLWNFNNIGRFFLSINGVFQILFDTKYNSFIDPWYKLNYVFSTSNPFIFALKHPVDLFLKWLKYFSLDSIRFFALEGVLWWTPLVIGYFVLAIKNKFSEETEKINYLLYFTGILLILQLIILPFWAGSIPYFFYLFPVFSLLISRFIYYIYQQLKEINYIKDLSVKAGFNKIYEFLLSDLYARILIITLVFISCFFIINVAFSGIFDPLSLKNYYVSLFVFFVLLGLIFATFIFYKQLPVLFLIIGLLFFISQTKLLNNKSQSEILRDRWDLEDNIENIKFLNNFNKGGISLSLTPWNIVWWSNNALRSAPIPEYPDEIYLLEKEYKQKIDSVYLNKIIKYPFEFISYAWNGYQRIINFGYSIEGFSVEKRIKDGIILAREKEILSFNTDIIDFGKNVSNSHLIWGWGGNIQEKDFDYTLAGDYNYLINFDKKSFTRVSEKKSTERTYVTVPDLVIFNEEFRIFQYFKPDAELTFLVNNNKPIKLEILAKSLIGDLNIDLYLNGNLLYRDQQASKIGTIKIGDKWTKSFLDLDNKFINNGLNKISFVFNIGNEYNNIDFLNNEVKPFAAFDYIRFYY